MPEDRILERLRAGLAGPTCAALLPKSPLGEAVGYARGNWAALAVFAERGELTIAPRTQDIFLYRSLRSQMR